MTTQEKSLRETAITLAKSPLGLIALFLVLIDSMASASIVFSNNLKETHVTILVVFIILFPILIFSAFIYLIIFHREKLYSPGDFKNEDNYMRTQDMPYSKAISGVLAPHDESPQSAPPRIVETQQPAISDDTVANSEGNEWLKPNASWTTKKYEIAYRFAVIGKNHDVISDIDKKYRNTEQFHHDDNAVAWEASCMLAHLKYGGVANLDAFRILVQRNATSARAIGSLADALMYFGRHNDAAQAFEKAVEHEKNAKRKLLYIQKAAVAYAEAGNRAASSHALGSIRDLLARDSISEDEALRAVKEIAKVSKWSQLELSALERILELNPSDAEARFSLAYRHSEIGNHSLALMHYMAIPNNVRDAYAWNNLGVALDHFHIYGKAVESYRESKELGETLAMANLARRFLGAGFLAEARAECESAMGPKNYDKSVPEALVRVQEISTEENDKVRIVTTDAKPASEFLARFGQATIGARSSPTGERWLGPDCELVVEESGPSFCAAGYYERSEGGTLGNVLVGGFLRPPPRKYVVEYKGQRYGMAIDATVTRRPTNDTTVPSILGSILDEKRVLLILAEDGSHVDAMELSGGKARFYSWTQR